MPRSLILHIGRNKTGTSSLQRSLADARDALSRHGIHYPAPGGNHHYLANHLSRRKRRRLAESKVTQADALAAKLTAAMDKLDGTIILSSEAFQTVPPRFIAEWLGAGTDVTVVIYIREQLDWLSSFYQQAVKAKLVTAPLEIFAERYDPDYRDILTPWQRVFGADNVRVRVYDRERLVNGDVVADFATVAGLPAGVVKTVEADVNPSIGGALLEAKRRVNGLGLDEEELRLATLKPMLTMAGSDPRLRAKPIAPASFVEAFRARYAESNDAVARRYFDGVPLFRAKAYPAEADFGEDEVRAALGTLAELTEAEDPDIAAAIRTRLVEAAAAS